jgi:hypothetical protein
MFKISKALDSHCFALCAKGVQEENSLWSEFILRQKPQNEFAPKEFSSSTILTQSGKE